MTGDTQDQRLTDAERDDLTRALVRDVARGGDREVFATVERILAARSVRDDPTLPAALVAEFGTDCTLAPRRDGWTCGQAGVARLFRCASCRLALVLADHAPADDPTRGA